MRQNSCINLCVWNRFFLYVTETGRTFAAGCSSLCPVFVIVGEDVLISLRKHQYTKIYTAKSPVG